jgi:hypothetical protein
MAFIQIIEFATSHIDDVEALLSEWETLTHGRRTCGCQECHPDT